MLYDPSNQPGAPHVSASDPHTIRPRILLVILAFLAASVAAISVRGSASITSLDLAIPGSSEAVGQGSLIVAGQRYEFVADNCFVSDDEFIATGTGGDTSGSYRVAASISSIELAFGTIDELSEPDTGQLWLQSSGPPSWSANNRTVTANVDLIDPLDPQSPSIPATLEITCPPSSDG